MKRSFYYLYEATAELKFRPSDASQIIDSCPSENWRFLEKYESPRTAVGILRRHHSIASVIDFGTYFLCSAVFVEEYIETRDDIGELFDRDDMGTVAVSEMPS